MSETKGFHPADYIREELEARGWSTADLADRMGAQDIGIHQLSVEILLEIGGSDLHLWVGRELSERLGSAFGCSPDLFLNLDRVWHEANGVTEIPEFATPKSEARS